ncbi:hypothetical protein BJY01DRAFT_242174 [Aspergillus pseudoustus]|uniref:Uncharacterized protein n=1 Tax=Aspergillus pseudoustus TaxID=1810923 RepID=A0ABR4KZN7_9EURO
MPGHAFGLALLSPLTILAAWVLFQWSVQALAGLQASMQDGSTAYVSQLGPCYIAISAGESIAMSAALGGYRLSKRLDRNTAEQPKNFKGIFWAKGTLGAWDDPEKIH